jgi:hypothetical protein
MCRASPAFAALEEIPPGHGKRLARSVAADIPGCTLAMTDCRVNNVRRPVVRGLHQRQLSALSGTLYVRSPMGCFRLRFED